ncbi:MAG: phosphoribosyl-AMP cyclohydrolase [Candidatus Omnitrophica bacterium]|nr:phosphoribosyl-AMP cyclohydrolase [Candidatus Omnitrophota bacterium]
MCAAISTGQGFWEILKFNEQGLIPAVIQDEKSGRVLTLCYLNAEALKKSLEEWKVYVFRRSQQRVMLKGETSGHIQVIRRIEVDCEGKSLLFHVKQEVAACHAGYFSCYHRRLASGGKVEISESPVFDPQKVYGA